MSEQQFNTLDEVSQILIQEINVQETRNTIQQFRIQFETVKNSILELEGKLKDFSFNEEEFATVEHQFRSYENDLKAVNNSVVKISTEIERLEKEFKKKKIF